MILELLGRIVSLANNFSPSANGCNKPKKPMTFGPFLLCIIPIIFLSAIVKYATEISKGTTIASIFSTVQIINTIIFKLISKTTINTHQPKTNTNQRNSVEKERTITQNNKHQ